MAFTPQQQAVIDVFKQNLGRMPGQAALDFYTNKLSSTGNDITQFANELANSPEGRDVAKAGGVQTRFVSQEKQIQNQDIGYTGVPEGLSVDALGRATDPNVVNPNLAADSARIQQFAQSELGRQFSPEDLAGYMDKVNNGTNLGQIRREIEFGTDGTAYDASTGQAAGDAFGIQNAGVVPQTAIDQIAKINTGTGVTGGGVTGGGVTGGGVTGTGVTGGGVTGTGVTGGGVTGTGVTGGGVTGGGVTGGGVTGGGVTPYTPPTNVSTSQLPIPDPEIAKGGSFAEPFFKTAYQEAFNQYNQGGPRYYGGAQVAGFSPQQLEAQRQAQNTNQQLNLLGQFQTGATARQLGQDIREVGIPGQVRAPTQVQQISPMGINPQLAQAVSRPLMQQLNENVLPGISSGATQAGAFGGSRQGILENQARSRTAGAVTDALARATQQQQQIGLNQRGQDIQQGQFSGQFLAGQRQQDINTALQQRGQNLGALQAGQSGASAARQGLLAGPGVLSGVGAQQQQMQQQLINANMQRYNYGQNAPQQNLAKLFGFLGGRPSPASLPNTTPASGFSRGVADATDAYNLYNLITG